MHRAVLLLLTVLISCGGDTPFPHILTHKDLTCYARAPEGWSHEYAYTVERIKDEVQAWEIVYDCFTTDSYTGMRNDWGPFWAVVWSKEPERLRVYFKEGFDYFLAGKCALLFSPAVMMPSSPYKEDPEVTKYRLEIGRRFADEAKKSSKCRN